jgi:hypothetical protein
VRESAEYTYQLAVRAVFSTRLHESLRAVHGL